MRGDDRLQPNQYIKSGENRFDKWKSGGHRRHVMANAMALADEVGDRSADGFAELGDHLVRCTNPHVYLQDPLLSIKRSQHRSTSHGWQRRAIQSRSGHTKTTADKQSTLKRCATKNGNRLSVRNVCQSLQIVLYLYIYIYLSVPSHAPNIVPKAVATANPNMKSHVLDKCARSGGPRYPKMDTL